MISFLSIISLMAETATNPEFSLLQLLTGTLGGAGISVFAAYLMFKSFTNQVDKKDLIYEKRIEALENNCNKLFDSAQECSKDRMELHNKFHEFEKSVLERNTVALESNNEILEKLRDKLQLHNKFHEFEKSVLERNTVALESNNEILEKLRDKLQLHNKFHEFEKSVLERNTVALESNNEILEKLRDKLHQEQ